MLRTLSLSLAALLALGTGSPSESQPKKVLTAPTYYIVAHGNFYGSNKELALKGASNLPPGSKFSVQLYDYIGNQSSMLSKQAWVVLDKSGLYEIELKAQPGKAFRERMVCSIDFDPHEVPQPESVRKIVGEKGEFLGNGRNPQVAMYSGENYSLSTLVYIP